MLARTWAGLPGDIVAAAAWCSRRPGRRRRCSPLPEHAERDGLAVGGDGVARRTLVASRNSRSAMSVGHVVLDGASLAPPPGFEPGTFRLEGGCSVH